MAATEINNVLGIDPRLDINSRKQRTNIVPQGARDISYQQTPSQSVSNSGCSFNVTVPNARTYVPRVVYLNVQGYTDFFGNSGLAGQNLVQAAGLPHLGAPGPVVSSGTANLVAPRCDPLNQIISNLSFNINGQQISSNVGQYARLLQRFYTDRDEQNLDLSMSPMMPDVSLSYAADEGSSISPLRSAQYNDYQLPRGAFPSVCITANTALGTNNDTARIQWSFTTPIILSPYCYSRKYQEKLAFVQITQLTYQFTFSSQSNSAIGGLSGSLWSWTNSQFFPNPPVINSAFTQIQKATLYNQFITPPDWMSIPKSIYYSYTVPTWYPNQANLMGIMPGKSDNVYSQAIQLNETPSSFIFYVGEDAPNADMTKPDVAFFAINSVTAQWDAGAPALSTLSQYDLYQSLHVVKGGTQSWREWSGAIGVPGTALAAFDSAVGQSGTKIQGSFCLCTIGTDIPLPSGDAPSCANQKHTLKLTINCTNLTNRTIVASCNVLMLQEGVFRIDDLIARQQTNIVTPAEVKDLELAAIQDPEVPKVPYYTPTSVLGGTFFGDLGRFFKKAARVGLDIAKATVPSEYKPTVNLASDLSEKYLGVGLGDAKGGRKGKVKGGAPLSRRQLAAYM